MGIEVGKWGTNGGGRSEAEGAEWLHSWNRTAPSKAAPSTASPSLTASPSTKSCSVAAAASVGSRRRPFSPTHSPNLNFRCALRDRMRAHAHGGAKSAARARTERLHARTRRVLRVGFQRLLHRLSCTPVSERARPVTVTRCFEQAPVSGVGLVEREREPAGFYRAGRAIAQRRKTGSLPSGTTGVCSATVKSIAGIPHDAPVRRNSNAAARATQSGGSVPTRHQFPARR